MSSERNPSSTTDRCPWCDEPITAAADPVTVVPKRGRSREEIMHHHCAGEWETFIEQARDLAGSGKRWSLIESPLQKGWEFNTGEE